MYFVLYHSFIWSGVHREPRSGLFQLVYIWIGWVRPRVRHQQLHVHGRQTLRVSDHAGVGHVFVCGSRGIIQALQTPSVTNGGSWGSNAGFKLEPFKDTHIKHCSWRAQWELWMYRTDAPNTVRNQPQSLSIMKDPMLFQTGTIDGQTQEGSEWTVEVSYGGSKHGA
jgi:hypothetical protein